VPGQASRGRAGASDLAGHAVNRSYAQDNKTIAMNSAANIAGLKVLEAMFKTHKIIPPGAISWDGSGNNKAYQSKQAAFVMNPTSGT
jgi:hypothetical protein